MKWHNLGKKRKENCIIYKLYIFNEIFCIFLILIFLGNWKEFFSMEQQKEIEIIDDVDGIIARDK